MNTTCISRGAKSATRSSSSTGFDVRKDLVFPASEVVGNLDRFLETIGKKVDTKDAVAEVDRLRDLLDSADDATHSTNATSAPKMATAAPEFIQSAGDYVVNMHAFFKMAEREIGERHNTDFDNIEFLIKGAKAEFSRFAKVAFNAEQAVEGGEA